MWPRYSFSERIIPGFRCSSKEVAEMVEVGDRAPDFTMLSDWNRTVSRAYGVQYDRFGSVGLEGVAKRSVFVLDRSGVVRYKWVTEDPKVPPDPTKVFEEVKAHAT